MNSVPPCTQRGRMRAIMHRHAAKRGPSTCSGPSSGLLLMLGLYHHVSGARRETPGAPLLAPGAKLCEVGQ
jgi:hypothetical protein